MVATEIFNDIPSSAPKALGPLSIYPAQPVPVYAGGNPGTGHYDEPEQAGF